MKRAADGAGTHAKAEAEGSEQAHSFLRAHARLLRNNDWFGVVELCDATLSLLEMRNANEELKRFKIHVLCAKAYAHLELAESGQSCSAFAEAHRIAKAVELDNYGLCSIKRAFASALARDGSFKESSAVLAEMVSLCTAKNAPVLLGSFMAAFHESVPDPTVVEIVLKNVWEHLRDDRATPTSELKA